MILIPKGTKYPFQAIGMIGSFGFLVGGSIFGGYLIGSYMDEWLGTSPWLLIVFVLLGIVGSFMEFFQIVKKVINREK